MSLQANNGDLVSMTSPMQAVTKQKPVRPAEALDA